MSFVSDNLQLLYNSVLNIPYRELFLNKPVGSHCTYIVTLRHVCTTFVAGGKAVSVICSECVCSLQCQAPNAHTPRHLWPVHLYSFSTLSHEGTI
jgi:hypothetical protein